MNSKISDLKLIGQDLNPGLCHQGPGRQGLKRGLGKH